MLRRGALIVLQFIWCVHVAVAYRLGSWELALLIYIGVLSVCDALYARRVWVSACWILAGGLAAMCVHTNSMGRTAILSCIDSSEDACVFFIVNSAVANALIRRINEAGRWQSDALCTLIVVGTVAAAVCWQVGLQQISLALAFVAIVAWGGYGLNSASLQAARIRFLMALPHAVALASLCFAEFFVATVSSVIRVGGDLEECRSLGTVVYYSLATAATVVSIVTLIRLPRSSKAPLH